MTAPHGDGPAPGSFAGGAASVTTPASAVPVSGEPPADIVVGGSWRGHWGSSEDLVKARWRVAALATVAAVLIYGGWAGRVYVAGSWRYFAEHRSALAPGLMCPTSQGWPAPGPGMLASIGYLGHGTPPREVAREYGCEPAARLLTPDPRPPLPPVARTRMR